MSTLASLLLSRLFYDEPDRYSTVYSIDKPSRADRKRIERLQSETIRDGILSGRRYHLSADVSQMASVFAFNAENIIEQVVKLARPTHDNIWLEWSLHDQMRAVGIEPASDAPKLCGANVHRYRGKWLITPYYVIDNPVVREPHLIGISKAMIAPVSILFDTSPIVEVEDLRADTQFLLNVLRLKKNRFKVVRNDVEVKNPDPPDPNEIAPFILNSTLLGGGNSIFEDSPLSGAHVKDILPYVRHVVTPVFGDLLRDKLESSDSESEDFRDSLRDVFTEAITEYSGMARFVMSALALINSRTYIQGKPIKANAPDPVTGKKPTGRTPTPAYDFVEMKVPKTVFIRDIQGTDHEKRHVAQHEVAGHFCHSHRVGDPNCQHTYVKQSETREICLMCGSKRWWRKTHERGDPELGIKPNPARLLLS